jgi:hypothetical protein
MPVTYEPIATTTLGTAASSITFSSISSAYTDLRLVVVSRYTDNGSTYLRYNNDSGSNYSYTWVYGTGSATGSYAFTSQTEFDIDLASNFSTTTPAFWSLDIFSYAGSTYKTALQTTQNDTNGSGTVERVVRLWRSTSAINQLNIYRPSGTFTAGTTATLYGIKNA